MDAKPNGQDTEFLTLLENGVRDILRNRKSTKDHKLSAINAGAKLLAIRHKLNGGEEKSYFE